MINVPQRASTVCTYNLHTHTHTSLPRATHKHRIPIQKVAATECGSRFVVIQHANIFKSKVINHHTQHNLLYLWYSWYSGSSHIQKIPTEIFIYKQ